MGYARKRTAPGGSQPPPSAPASAPRQQSAAKPSGGSSGKSIWSMQIGTNRLPALRFWIISP